MMQRLPRSLTAALQGRSYPRSINAAVQRMEFSRPNAIDTTVNAKEDDWQAEAWSMYNMVGELFAVTRWMGSSAARVALVATEVDESTGRADTPTENPAAIRIVSDMAGGATGQSDMLRQAAVLLTVVGEFYVVILQNEEGGSESWQLVAPDLVSKDQQSGKWAVKIDGKERVLNADSESIFRVWDRDPHYPEKATSSVRAALPVLREIVAMDKTIQKVSRSRIAGNGILAIPKEADIPDPNPPTGPGMDGVKPPFKIGGSDSAANLSRSLASVMRRAVDDPDSLSAVAPVVISAPGEHIGNIRHITLGSDITTAALDTREKAIRRLALSLDIPPEILTGLGDSTHWNASLVDESALRQHIAPMMSTICEALTEAVLHPFLDDDESPGDTDNIVVGFDMSALSQKQDNSANALQAYDNGAISIEALRRELGFGDDDAPTAQNDTDRRRALAERMVSQAPSLFPMLKDELGFGNVDTSSITVDAQPSIPTIRSVASHGDK